MATEQVKVKLSAEGQKQVVGALKQVQAQAVKTGKQGAAGIGSMNAALGNLKSILPALGIAAVVVGFGRLIKGSLDFAESLDKASQRTGITAESLSTLAFAVELSGTSFEIFEKGVTKLARTMSDAQAGLATAQRPFDQLGISVKKADGTLRSTEEVFGDVADRFSQMEDGSKKTALALEIFGRAGAELIPTLNAGREGIAAMQDEARTLGLEISTNTARQAAIFKDNISRLSNAFVGIGNIILAKILPTFINLTDRFVDFVRDGEVVQKVANGMAATFRVLSAVVTGLVAGFTNLAIAAKAAFEVIKEVGSGTLSGFALLGASTKEEFDEIAAASKGSFGNVKQIISDALAEMQGVSDAAWESIKADFTDTASVAETEAPKIKAATDEIFSPDQIEKINRFDQQIEKLRTNIKAFGKDNAEAAEINAIAAGATKEQAAAIRELVEELEALREKAKAAADAERELTDAQKKAADAAAKEAEERAKALAEKIERETVTLAEVGTEAQDALSEGFVRMITTGEGFKDTMVSLIRTLAVLFARMIAFRIFGSFFRGVFGGATGSATGGALNGGGGGPLAAAGGGFVRGIGGPTSDTIAARLSPGEFVVRAASVSIPGVLPLLASINSSTASASGMSFAAGGLVPDLRGRGGDINVFVDAPGAEAGSELRIEQAVRKAVTLSLLASADAARRE